MKRILVALDSSERAAAVLAAAIDLARATGGRLWLLRAVGLPVGVPRAALSMTPAEVEELLRRDAQAGLDDLARAVPPSMLEGQHVRVGTAWHAIVDEARDRDVDLVVIGSHGHQFLDRVLGTTAKRVVDHVDRSVLVVRPRPPVQP